LLSINSLNTHFFTTRRAKQAICKLAVSLKADDATFFFATTTPLTVIHRRGIMESTKPNRRWYFKYGRCTHTELVRFLQDRTGTTVGINMKTGKARLLARLRELDRNPTFPHFLDISLELRLRVYEHLLAPDKELRELSPDIQPTLPKGQIQTAVLRTSKAIYSEAEPVLYKANHFDAVLTGAPRPNYTFQLERPGCVVPYSDDSDKKMWAWVFKSGMMRRISPMLSGIRRLTIKLDLGQTPDNTQAQCASAIITRLCMLMCGDTKMEELIFSLRSQDKNSSVVASTLPQIFWPIILLRSDVAVRFEGVSEGPGSQQLEYDGREAERALLPPGTAEAMCKLVAKLRRRCEAARVNACSESTLTLDSFSHSFHVNAYWEMGLYMYGRVSDDTRDNELVEDLVYLAVIVDTVDIASGSARWKMLQGLVEDAETEMKLDE
jgi:hypothetical protein